MSAPWSWRPERAGTGDGALRTGILGSSEFVLFVAATAVLGACGKESGDGGIGGATSSSASDAHASSSSATGGASPAAHCTSYCDGLAALAAQLGCSANANCASQCESVYGGAPKCTAEVDAYIDCEAANASPTTCHCNAGTLDCSGMGCDSETKAYNACYVMNAGG